ncbi:MAG TPA: glycosyltransferase family 2 protein [Thermoplasmata archaeon]|nr:glycosyltransferase family 2 protein [Thermoplasmata archaeon]
MHATLVIPTLNEGKSIGHVLRTFRTAADSANTTLFKGDPVTWEILVVDGQSTDDTAANARAGGAVVINEPRKGYGRAYRTGFAAATGEYIATLDGDATYPAENLPELLRYLIDHQLDFLSGDRLEQLDRRSMTTEHRIGNWWLNYVIRVAYHRYLREVPGHRMRDSQSGMWVFRRSILEHLRITQDGMPLSEEVKLEVLIRGFRFGEVPIRYAERWGPPKLSSWRDGRHNLTFLFAKRVRLQREIRSAPPLPRPEGSD